jgi:hypothetical protein
MRYMWWAVALRMKCDEASYGVDGGPCEMPEAQKPATLHPTCRRCGINHSSDSDCPVFVRATAPEPAD